MTAELTTQTGDLAKNDSVDQFKKICSLIREDMRDNPYIKETLRVLPVGGYRSAIGSFWNAVVDDLRNKIIFRSLALFNKEMKPSRQINKYEDFQDVVNDQTLIDGAFKIGVIDWEAHKLLTQAKETRHIFDGHPRSSDPDLLKVLSMMSDCIKYVLGKEYPSRIIDINQYINVMGEDDYDRNEYTVKETMEELPDIYKSEFANKLFNEYINENCSSIFRSNIEFVAPLLLEALPEDTMRQISKRLDQEISNGNATATEYAFAFFNTVGAKKYLSTRAKKHLLGPIIKLLSESLGKWGTEDRCVGELSKYAGYIPRELLPEYVNAITQTYVGYIGHSSQYARTDFYADGASQKIPAMFEKFDDESAKAFVETLKTNQDLRRRINDDVKLARLRKLGEIVSRHISENFEEAEIVQTLIDKSKESDFFALINKYRK
jgi:hypothetical protein